MRRFALSHVLVLVTVGMLQGIVALKPQMYPAEEEILIQEGDFLEIKCRGEDKLQFSTERNFAWVNQSEFDISFNNDSGWNTFTRSNAIKEDTGWYACAEEGIEILNHEMIIDHPDTNISWIYVYVNSSKPFAIDTYDCDDHFADLPVLWPLKSDVVLPCRPTSPDLPVMAEIYCSRTNGNLPVPENTRYDPKIGFMLNPQDCLSILEQVYENLCSFKCKINRTDRMTDLWQTSASDIPEYRVAVLTQSVWIDEGLEVTVIVGMNLTLTCDLYINTFGERASVYWKIPESVPIYRRGYSKAFHHKRHLRFIRFKLTIYNVEITDRGDYTCAAENPWPGDRSQFDTINVLETSKIPRNIESFAVHEGVHVVRRKDSMFLNKREA